MTWVLVLAPLLAGGYGVARVLDLDLELARWWRRYRVQGRHSVSLIVKKWQEEEAAYQAVLDKVWAGYIADMAVRMSYRR